jgi:NAD(P)-dependent dehydrogenase (short-subunit alcohol dehydrogenase family)
MPGRLASKVAIITGSSSGIGRAIALAFASEGASLLLSDLTPNFRPEYPTDSLPGTTLDEAIALGARAAYYPCDTTKSGDVQALVAKAVETYGRLDIMGTSQSGKLKKVHLKRHWESMSKACF